MFYFGIIPRVGTRFKTGTSLTCTCVVGHHHEPNMYYIQLLNKDHKGHPKVVNHHQIYDLNHSSPPSESLGSNSKDGDTSVVPSFLHHNHNGSNITTFVDPIVPHHYNTRSKLKATAAGRQVSGENTKLLIYNCFIYKVHK